MTYDTNPLRDHTISIYREMEKAAKLNEYDELVFEGYYSKLFDGLGISRSYYTRIRSLLRRLGCIEVLQKGAGPHGSRIILQRAPVPEDFTDSTLTERRETATLVRELERRVKTLEAWRLAQTGSGSFNIADALRNHEQRLSLVEQERANAKATQD